MAEEFKRNNKELSLLDRGLEEAKIDPRRAQEKVAMVTRHRLGETEDNKAWKRAEKELRRKEKAELHNRMLYGTGLDPDLKLSRGLNLSMHLSCRRERIWTSGHMYLDTMASTSAVTEGLLKRIYHTPASDDSFMVVGRDCMIVEELRSA